MTDQKIVPITILMEAGKFNTETLEVEINPGMEAAIAKNTVKEVFLLQREIEELKKQLEKLKKDA